MNRQLQAALGLPGLAPRSFRLLAVTIDAALVGVLFGLTMVGAVAGGLGVGGALGDSQLGVLKRIGSGGLGAGGIVLAVVAGVGVCVLTLYQWYLVASSGQTIGKRLFGIRIVDVATGKPAGFIQGLVIRSWLLATLTSLIVFLVGWLFPPIGALVVVLNLVPIFGVERRCLHDYLAGTQVRWVEARSEQRMRIALVVGGVGVTIAAAGSLAFSPEVRALVSPALSRLVPKAAAPVSTVVPPEPAPVSVPVATVAPVSEPAPAVAVPTPPVVEPVAPQPVAPAPAAHAVYSWVDGSGTTSFTDNLDTVPAKYRASVRKVDGD